MAYNWDLVGNCMSFSSKLMKHVNQGNCSKIKDYLCAAYDNFNPEEAADHPCYSIIKNAADYLRSNGWQVWIYNWGPGKGVQLTVVFGDKYYRSHYQH